MALVRLYLDANTSEVSSEHATLHEAITAAAPTAGAMLFANGYPLATVLELGTAWTLTTWGAKRLTLEDAASAQVAA